MGVQDPIDSIARALSLTRAERVALSKIVRSPEESLRNSMKVVPPHIVKGSDLGVDGFNVIITVERALAGDPVYVCTDGIVRDLSLSYSSYKPSDLFDRAVETIADTVRSMSPGRVTIYLDSPIPKSGSIAKRIREITSEEFEVKTSNRVDSEILSHEIVASSDSRIIEGAKAIVDLAHAAISRAGISPKRLFTDRGMLGGI